ncbi:MAG: hypothetical protein HEP71_04345 [Roseivirga sp.]|nr:hypothetical protein [Roseivirga sp.]
MSQRPLNLQLVIDILNYASQHQEPLLQQNLNPNGDEKDRGNLEWHFETLGKLEVVELNLMTEGDRVIPAITSLKPIGNELVNLFKNKEVLSQITSQFGQEITGDQLATMVSVGSKILGDILKRDPEKKAKRQEKRQEKRRQRKEEKESFGVDFEADFVKSLENIESLKEQRDSDENATEVTSEATLGGKETDSSQAKGGLRVSDFKERLTSFARKQIPEELKHVIRIPATVQSNRLYVQSSDRKKVVDTVSREFGQRSVSVRIDSDLEVFGFNARPDDLLTEFIDYADDESLFRIQEEILLDNLNEALSDSQSKIALLIEKYQEESQPINTEQLKQQTAQQKIAEPIQEVVPELPPEPPETIDNPLQLAHLNSDSAHKGKDLLGFEQDVEAFAAIMALEKLTPPLAIALFGQWGTGKSFFMQKLSEKVEELAKHQGFLKKEDEEKEDDGSAVSAKDEKPFCEGICQIHFNAWSYMDTNLWASLVTRIFEKLDDYINDNRSEAEKEVDTIKSGIAEQLDVAKGQIAELEARKAQVKNAIDTLQGQVTTAQGELKDKIGEIKTISRQEAITKAIKESKIEENLKGMLDKAGITKDKLDQVNPDLILKELKSGQTFVRQFLNYSGWDWGLIGVGAVLLVISIFVLPELANLDTIWLNGIGSALGVLTAILSKVRGTTSKLSPLVNGVLKVKSDYDTAVNEAISKHKQEILAKQIEADQKEVELNQLNLQLKAKEAEIKEIEYKPDSVLAQKAMYNFITRKAASNDYSRHLGIISMIRKDFQTLSELFVESTKTKKVPEKSKEKYKQFKEIRDGFDKPLQRIVLYIDDLDRCPEERVVEVLEAVNLLMAFPLFVVVVGVDPRWVKNALIKKYHLQFTGHMKGSQQEVDSLGMEVINPSDYLEKIFQIPFHLKAPEDESIKNMISHLLGDAVAEKSEEPVKEKVDTDKDRLPDIDLDAFFEEKSKEMRGIPNEVPDMPAEVEEEAFKAWETENELNPGIPAMAAPEGDEEATADETAEEVAQEDESKDSEDGIPEGLKVVTPASLKLHWEEGEYMRNLSWLIGNTPRTVKRFVNMYRIIRAHEGLSYEDDESKNDLLSIMFLLALQNGQYHQYSESILTAIFNGIGGPTFSDVIHIEISHASDDKVEYLKNTYSEFLNQFRNSETFRMLRDVSCTKIYSYCRFIKRFSFNIVSLKEF